MVAAAIVGCGEDPGIEEGVVPPKSTDTSPLRPLRDDMMRKMKDRSYLEKGGGAGRPAAAPVGPAESGPVSPPSKGG
jgi:hypothetical protein